MKKHELRVTYKNLRKKISEEEVDDLSLQIANQLLKLPIWQHHYYHIFLPIEKQKEVNTTYILHALQGKDKHVIISKSNFENNTLVHFLLTDQTILKENQWGIPEPVDGIEIPSEKIDIVFVPLLAYDSLGYRVGYGKGFYDRFLAEAKPKAIVGLSFFEPEIQPIEDLHVHDIALDYCVTPTKLYTFKK